MKPQNPILNPTWNSPIWYHNHGDKVCVEKEYSREHAESLKISASAANVVIEKKGNMNICL